MKYKDEVAGEWIYPKKKGYKMMCCDCGLVHILEFKIAKFGKRTKGYIHFRCWRDNRATAGARKKLKKVLK